MVFENCINDVRYEDAAYLYCPIELNESACGLLQQMHDVKNARGLLIAIPLILSLFALTFNISFGAMTIHFYKKTKHSVDHHHALLLSETISALIAQVLFYSTLLLANFGKDFGYTSVAVCICIAWMTFFVHAGSYFANTSLLFLAVVRPLKYRNVLTIKQSVTLLLAIWSTSTFLALCMGLSSATIFFPLAAPLECNVLQCQKLLGFGVVFTFSTFYMIVVALYIVMLWRINKRRYSSQNEERDRALRYSSVRAMKRLALQLSAFIISGTPIVATSSFTLAHLDQIELLGLEAGSPCSFLVKGRLFGQAERLLCLNVSAWILPMISAPLISCYFDANKHEVIRHKLGLKCGSLNNHQSSARSVT